MVSQSCIAGKPAPQPTENQAAIWKSPTLIPFNSAHGLTNSPNIPSCTRGRLQWAKKMITRERVRQLKDKGERQERRLLELDESSPAFRQGPRGLEVPDQAVTLFLDVQEAIW